MLIFTLKKEWYAMPQAALPGKIPAAAFFISKYSFTINI